MKCLKCNNSITEDQLNCPGCGTSIEELKQSNLLLLEEENKEENVEVSDDIKETEVVPEQNVEVNISEPVQTANHTKSKKSKMSLFVIVAVVAFLIIILGVSYFVAKSPKSIFTRSINDLYKNVEVNLKENVKTLSTNFELKLNVDGNEENKELTDIVNNLSLKGNVNIDYINKLFLVSFNSTYANDKLLDAEVQYQKGNAYVLLNDVFDKYIAVDSVEGMDDYFETVQITKDHKVLVTEVKKALTKSLKSKFFETSKVELEINGKKENVTKNTLKLTKENMIELTKEFLEALKNDDKFLRSYAKINNTDEATVKDSLESEIASIDGEDLAENAGEINLYTKGLFNELVKIEMLVYEGSDSLELSLTKKDNNNYVVRLLTTDKEEFILNVNVTKEGNTLNLKISTNVERQNILLDIKYGYEYDKEFTLKDVSNSVNINELTEEQATEIMNKLSQNAGFQKIIEAISKIENDYGDIEDDFDYDYDDGSYDDIEEDYDFNF